MTGSGCATIGGMETLREFAIMTAGVVRGADIAEVAADPELVRQVRRDHPSLAVAVAPASEAQATACVLAGAGLLAGDAFAGVAEATGTTLICTAPNRGAGRLVRAADLREAEELAGQGHSVLAEEEQAALTAVYAWLGARVFRTQDVAATRQVLDMVASIKGTRPPAVTRRGLA